MNDTSRVNMHLRTYVRVLATENEQLKRLVHNPDQNRGPIRKRLSNIRLATHDLELILRELGQDGAAQPEA